MMTVKLEWTADMPSNSPYALDANHNRRMSRDDFHRAGEALSDFLNIVAGTKTTVEWYNDYSAEIVPTLDEEQEYSTDDDGHTSEVFELDEALFDDIDWKLQDTLTLISDVQRLGQKGVMSIDFTDGSIQLSQHDIIRMANRYALLNSVSAHRDLLAQITRFRTGFMTVRTEKTTITLNQTWIRDFEKGLEIALYAMRISQLI
ncbi:hypothetical protein [Bifidobacterium cebidarum]|uniref:Uncharacterized protein n=1 Tax=Bifidobacterium cebidarum TaxID=2650773 RepID=A0A6I1GK97_9BIFI|nr:hypothetical protein [Bifidobacterium cebidarum]KAB7788338.1 hypothetical protein F7D08_1079 [Bifidobacterium cebidarum]